MGDEAFGPVMRGGQRPGPNVTVGTGDETFGPVMRGGRERGLSVQDVFRSAMIATAVITLGVVIGGVALGGYLTAKMQRADVGGLNGNPLDELNVLVVGSDSREGFTRAELQALGTDAVAGQRTDTIFLVSISGGRAAMLSFPRDLFVTRCDGTWGRINGAYTAGGPTCLTQTVGQLTGIGIDDYLEINLFGLSRIVDAAGGVPIELDQPLLDRAAGANLPAGCVVLDSRTALGYIRARNADSSADLGRIARQQRFLAALSHKVTSPKTLVNVPRLLRMAAAAGSSVTADQGLGPIDLVRLARGARDLAGAGLATYTVPGRPKTIGGADLLVPDRDAAGALFAQFRDGSILRAPAREKARSQSPLPSFGEDPGDAPDAREKATTPAGGAPATGTCGGCAGCR
jgi:LCP family protein required for cell wall assembly